MDKEILINRVAEALKDDHGAYFVGSGISYESIELDWFKLLQPLTSELGIELDKEHDDLTLIAQYIVNQYSGNRGPLIQRLYKAFNKKFSINKYHRALSCTKVPTIWTTNYDMLLEEAFLDFFVDVKVNESSISKLTNNAELEIIKMHGCISKSEHSEIVITAEDYEDFLIKKPAIAHRLCNDLMKKTFLFMGYSYRDTDIRNIMVVARRLCKEHPQEHFLILKKVGYEDVQEHDKNIQKQLLEEKIRRQELWCRDLKRLGISTLFIDKHDELEEILISISQRARGKTVYVTGSHEKGCEVARKLGEMLAKEKDVILVSGQSSGVGASAVSGFMEECILEKIDMSHRVKIFPNPYAANPKYSNDLSLIGELKKYRSKLLYSTQVAVVFCGNHGTKAEVEAAIRLKCKIIPVILTPEERDTEGMQQIFKEKSTILEEIEKKDKEYHKKLIDGSVTLEDIYKCLMKFLK